MRTAVWLQAAKRRKKCEIPGFFQRFPYFWRKSVLAVPVCLMTVFPGGFPVALDLGLRQGTDHLGGAANLIAILNVAQSGDHVVSMASIYGGTFNLFAVTLKKMGIEVTFVDQRADDAEIE